MTFMDLTNLIYGMKIGNLGTESWFFFRNLSMNVS
jgi:hypothetical protein